MSNRPQDLGPIYAETLMGRFPVEPLNTISNLAFLLIIVYWGLKIRSTWRDHYFLLATLPILLLGFIGGTMYHATRSDTIWLILDFVPIGLLTLSSAFFFWHRLSVEWPFAMFYLLAPVIAIRLIAALLELSMQFRINAGYAGLAIGILAPAFLLAFRMCKGMRLLLSAVASFAIALLCRVLDGTLGAQLLPGVGTHFLWHLFGALAVHFLICFVYLSSKPNPNHVGGRT